MFEIKIIFSHEPFKSIGIIGKVGTNEFLHIKNYLTVDSYSTESDKLYKAMVERKLSRRYYYGTMTREISSLHYTYSLTLNFLSKNSLIHISLVSIIEKQNETKSI